MPERVSIYCDKAPAAIGPYVQGVKIGEWIYLSGQIPLDTESGEVVGDDIETQTEQILNNLTAILQFCGLQISNIVKTTVFLTDLQEFEVFNEVYGKFFSFNPPARSTVQVAGLPKGVKVEIEAIAYAGTSQSESTSFGLI